MQEIIKISQTIIGNDEANSVNARDIHTYLGVKTVFANWIDRAIKKLEQLISTQETQIKTYNIYKGVKNLINIKTMKGGIKL